MQGQGLRSALGATVAGLALAMSAAPTGYGGLGLPIRRRARAPTDTRYLRNTKGWTGGGYKGSAKAKRATRRGGNPAAQR